MTSINSLSLSNPAYGPYQVELITSFKESSMDWVKKNALCSFHKQTLEGNCPFKDEKTATDHALSTFNNSISTAEKQIKPHLDKEFSTASTLHKAIRYLFWFIEDRYLHYTFEFPEDKKIQKEWDSFKHDFALLNYNRDPSIHSKIHSFIDNLMEQLKRCKIYSGDYENDLIILTALKPTIDNPDINDIPLYELGNRSNNFSVVDLQDAFELALRKAIDEIRWGVLRVKEMIQPLENANSVIEWIEDLDSQKINRLPTYTELMAFLDTVMDEHQPLLYSLINKGIKDHSKTIKTIMEIHTAHRNPQIIPGDIENIITNSILQVIKLSSEREQILNESKKVENTHNLDEIALSKLEDEVNISIVQIELTIDIYKEQLESMRILQNCHVIWDFYVTNPLTNCINILKNINKWHEYKRKAQFNRMANAIDAIVKERRFSERILPSRTPNIAIQDINTLVRDITKGTSTSQKTKKRVGQKKKIKSSPSHSLIPSPSVSTLSAQRETPYSISAPLHSETAEILNLDDVKAPRLLHAPSTYEQTLMRIITIASSIPNNATKNALMNAHFSLQDLAINQHFAQTALTQKNQSLILNSAFTNCFYCIEQILQYKNLVINGTNAKIHDHNLRKLLLAINLDNLLNSPFIDKIDRAHVWVAYPDEQIRLWQKLSTRSSIKMPSTLSLLTDKSKNTRQIKDEINTIFHETITFVHQQLKKKKGKTSPICTSIPPIPIPFTITLDDNLINLHKTLKWNTLLQQEWHSNGMPEFHPANIRLKQAMRALSYFHQTITQFKGSKQTTSHEFRYFVRSSIFWFNNFIENYLHSKLIQKNTSTQHSHNIAKLLQSLIPSATSEDITFFEKSFARINNDVRYPYNNTHHSLSHQLIQNTDLIKMQTEELEHSSCSSHTQHESIQPNTIITSLNELFENSSDILQKYL